MLNEPSVNNPLVMLGLNFVWMPVNGLLVSVHCMLVHDHHHVYMCVYVLHGLIGVPIGHGQGWMGA